MINNFIFMLVYFLVLSTGVNAEQRDPTTPLSGVVYVSSSKPLVLQAIYSSGTKRTAVINNKSVTRGGAVNSWTVEKILDDGVQLRKGKSVKILNLRTTVLKLARDKSN